MSDYNDATFTNFPQTIQITLGDYFYNTTQVGADVPNVIEGREIVLERMPTLIDPARNNEDRVAYTLSGELSANTLTPQNPFLLTYWFSGSARVVEFFIYDADESTDVTNSKLLYVVFDNSTPTVFDFEDYSNLSEDKEVGDETTNPEYTKFFLYDDGDLIDGTEIFTQMIRVESSGGGEDEIALRIRKRWLGLI
jgi:hypothetical protein